MSIFFPLALLVYAITAFYRREWGVYLIILGLPTYQIRFAVLGIPATFLEGMILLCALATILPSPRSPASPETRVEAGGEGFRVRVKKIFELFRRDKPTHVFIALFLLAAGISVFVGPDMIKAAGIFKAYFFEAVVFYFLVRLAIDSPGKLQKLFETLAMLALYLSVFGLYQYLTLQNLPPSWWDVGWAERRIVSLLNHPNGLALLLGPILAMLIFRQPKTKLTRAAIIFGLPAFYLTFSRAGWLALAATIVSFGVLQFKKNNSPSPPLSLGGGTPPFKLRGGWEGLLLSLLLIVIVVFAIPISRTKLTSLASADPSKENRYVLWSAAADMIKQHPITGMGIGGFREAYKNYPLGPDRVVQNYPHNFLLTFWVEIGLLGILSLIGLLILFYRKIYKTLASPTPPHKEGIIPTSPPRPPAGRAGEGEIERGLRNYALAVGAGMAMIVIHSLVDVSYFKNDLAVLFWLVCSLPFISFQN